MGVISTLVSSGFSSITGYISSYFYIILMAASFAGGWFINGWYTDSVELAKKEAIERALSEFREKESKTARAVEDKLSQLKANERVRTISVPEIIKQPVFKNVCISNDGIDSINAAINELQHSDISK